MSGPSTRSHRSSVCEMDTTLAELSQMVKAGKSVVLITGAGLSAASGEFRYPYSWTASTVPAVSVVCRAAVVQIRYGREE